MISILVLHILASKLHVPINLYVLSSKSRFMLVLTRDVGSIYNYLFALGNSLNINMLSIKKTTQRIYLLNDNLPRDYKIIKESFICTSPICTCLQS